MSAALVTTYITYLKKISKEALENSKLVELLNESGNIKQPSKQGNSIITPEIIYGLKKHIEDTIKPNAIGINSGIKAGVGNMFNGFQSKKKITDLIPLEKHILRNLSYYQN